MDKRLEALIRDFLSHVAAAADLLVASGITLAESNRDWALNGIPPCGEMGLGFSYRKHGYGCEVTGPDWSVDFDFGDAGEITGFDVWRLHNYSVNSANEYSLTSYEEIKQEIERAHRAGLLTRVWPGALYFMARTV